MAQVIHGYGDVCQAVTELADETSARITADEFHTLNRCLDDAIAEAVTEYARLRESAFAEGETQRSGVLAHEMRNRFRHARPWSSRRSRPGTWRSTAAWAAWSPGT